MSAIDNYAAHQKAIDAPARDAAIITPHDTNELTNVTRAIYVGGAGDIVVITISGDTVTFSGVPVGTILPVRVKIVKSTSTTATNLVALW